MLLLSIITPHYLNTLLNMFLSLSIHISLETIIPFHVTYSPSHPAWNYNWHERQQCYSYLTYLYDVKTFVHSEIVACSIIDVA